MVDVESVRGLRPDMARAVAAGLAAVGRGEGEPSDRLVGAVVRTHEAIAGVIGAAAPGVPVRHDFDVTTRSWRTLVDADDGREITVGFGWLAIGDGSDAVDERLARPVTEDDISVELHEEVPPGLARASAFADAATLHAGGGAREPAADDAERLRRVHGAVVEGLVSARRMAREAGTTLDDLADACVAAGLPRPYDL